MMVADAGKKAIAAALELWNRGIVDPKVGAIGKERELAIIDDLIRGPQGLGWNWMEPYRGDGMFEWCGAACAYFWGAAGLAAHWRRKMFASTFRLDCYGAYRPFDDNSPNPAPPRGKPRRGYLVMDENTTVGLMNLFGFKPQPGDILLVGLKSYGSHICLVEDYSEGEFSTIEGNGFGKLPDGSLAQGIVRAKRPLGAAAGKHAYHARRLIRPCETDLA